MEPNSRYYSNHWLTAITLDPSKTNGIDRESVRLALERDAIESRPLWKPMHLQPIFKSFPFFGEHHAERLFDQGLCLPSGSNLTEQEWERIEKALHALFR
jgi:dTDP-4-amino-4,6-dideoxygalactose transaminase